jgi:hypothetical protein
MVRLLIGMKNIGFFWFTILILIVLLECSSKEAQSTGYTVVIDDLFLELEQNQPRKCL